MTDHRRFMELAVEQARLSDPKTAVGAVLVRDDEVLACGYRGEDGGKHAEAVAIEKAVSQGKHLAGATAYVTLEPCSNLQSKTKACCADLLAAAGVTKVYIGRYDNNPRIHQLGWKALREKGILCFDFEADLREMLDEVNGVFPQHFVRRTKPKGRAKFDFTQNGGRYDLALDDTSSSPVWITRWGTRGTDSVYAIGGTPGTVARALYRTDFSEVDRAGAYDFGGHFVPLNVGEIGIFRNEHGYALVKVITVEQPEPYGHAPHVSLTFDYELRPLDAAPDGAQAPS